MQRRNSGSSSARRAGAMLLFGLLALLALFHAATAAAMAPPATVSPPGTATEPAAAPVTPPSRVAPPRPPSDACDTAAGSTKAEAAFVQLLAASPSIKRIQVLSRYRFLPVLAATEVYAVDKYSEAMRYRAFVTDAAAPAKLRAVDDRWVWSEAARPETRGIDSRSTDDKSAKTVVHFTPPALRQWHRWNKHQFYFLACGAGNVPIHAGQLTTYLTKKTNCFALAFGLCVFFYVMAALTSWRIHCASRKHRGQGSAHGLNGTNYASAWEHFNPVILTADQDGRGSASRLQVLFFSFLVFGVVAYIWMATGNLSDMSVTVLSLMGISGVGAGAAAAAETSRKRLSFENWAWLIDRKWLPEGGAAEVNRAEWKDLFMTNNRFEVSRFQMITFSILVGIALITAGGGTADLSDFTIPDAFLGILGLSQVVYIIGKLVDGPSIEQLNVQIDALRAAETALRHALIEADSATPPASRTLRLTRQDLPEALGKAYDAYLETWERTRTMFESTLSEKVTAVAHGFRPPFPYLSLPDEALATLERQYAEIQTRLVPKVAGSRPPADNTTIEEVQNARDAYAQALEHVQDALKAFHAAKKENDEATSMLPDDVENRYITLFARENAIRTALENMRKAVARLERLAQS
jgi:hypothetical protein